jgi:hypothetical protein
VTQIKGIPKRPWMAIEVEIEPQKQVKKESDEWKRDRRLL